MYNSADASLRGPGMVHSAPGLTQSKRVLWLPMQMHVTLMFCNCYVVKLLRSVTFYVSD